MSPASCHLLPLPLCSRLKTLLLPTTLATALASLWLSTALLAQPGLTIYPNGLSIVRDSVPLELKEGENLIRYSGATAQLEPSSVLLRDPAGKTPLKILEQNYRNDPITSQSLLERFENQPQTVSFLVHEPQKPDRIVEGRVIRSGYVPGGQPVEPIIEVDGKLLFELPGKPLFAALKEDNILKPQLLWKILSPSSVQLEAELAYLTGGLQWEASYNLILPEASDLADLAGWVTLQNHTGKTFENAKIKLLAGNVHRAPAPALGRALRKSDALMAAPAEPEVTEKAFDDYHLYSLPRPTTLRDQETKQLEFVRGTGVPTRRIYRVESLLGIDAVPRAPEPGFAGNPPPLPVLSFLEFQNAEPAKLGVPLPAGTIRAYRKDSETLELVGEDRIPHTPAREKITLLLGQAFDLVAERKQIRAQVDPRQRTAEQTHEIRLRNRSKKAVQIEVVERCPAGPNWTLLDKSMEPLKADAQTLVFPVSVPAEGEAQVRYTLRFNW